MSYNKGDFPDDTFTESEVLSALEGAGLKYKNGHRYILSQCPTHDDQHPSVQIYKDDWFVNCHSGCGRYHITKAFPQLRPNGSSQPAPRRESTQSKMTEHKYKVVDLMKIWKKLPEIPRDHVFKGIPLEVLDDLGWRYSEELNSYFIPYWNMSKTQIPFAQWRHLKGDRRFTFWKDARPLVYGLQNLDSSNSPLFVAEGTSDCAVLDYCAVPWVGMPSAASAELMKGLAKYCKENGIELIYAGDNDDAGDKLREALDSVMSYRLKQPPKKYKDWGDFLVAEGFEVVNKYCFEELYPPEIPEEELSDVDKVLEVFPGAKVLKVADSEESKEQSAEPATLF